jgi:hypothetical protein
VHTYSSAAVETAYFAKKFKETTIKISAIIPMLLGMGIFTLLLQLKLLSLVKYLKKQQLRSINL